MRFRHLLPVLLVALVALIASTPAARAAPLEGFAVVNMVELLSKHPRVKEIEQEFDRAQKAAQEYADAENKSLRALKEEIELMQRNNPVRRGKEKQFLAQSAMLKFELEWRKDEALQGYMKSLEALYAEIQALVSRYARENGLHIVLQAPPDELQAADLNDFFAKVQVRTVVFSEPALDITERIKAMYARPGGAGSPPGGG